MSYHSAQIHLAVTRLIAAYGFAALIPSVDCNTIEVDGNIVYQITAKGDARCSLARVLCDALGERTDWEAGGTLLSLADAKKLLESAYS